GREDLEALAEVLRGTDIMVISDEIYAELTYGQRHVSMANLPDMYERTIVINGFSKAYSMTGWRMGYVCGPQELVAAMTKLHQYGIMSPLPPASTPPSRRWRTGTGTSRTCERNTTDAAASWWTAFASWAWTALSPEAPSTPSPA